MGRRSRIAVGVGQWALLRALLVPLNGLRVVVSGHSTVLFRCLRSPMLASIRHPSVAIPLAVAGGLAVLASFICRGKFACLAPKILLALSPLVAVTLGQALSKGFVFPPGPFACPAVKPRLEGEASRRSHALWIVFDEWDQRLSFKDRPAKPWLPELDRFRSESLYAANAYPPSGQTMRSAPALSTGRVVAAAEGHGWRSGRTCHESGSQPV